MQGEVRMYQVSGLLLQEIVNYLQKQPWSEVNNLLYGINGLLTPPANPTSFVQPSGTVTEAEPIMGLNGKADRRAGRD